MSKVHNEEKYQFRGLFVPASAFELLDNSVISPIELVFLMTVERFTSAEPNGLPCWASYEYLGEHVGLGSVQIRRMVNKLAKIGLLHKAGTLTIDNGEKRPLLVTTYPSNY